MKKRVLLVLDGLAESTASGSTTLTTTDAPHLDRLARSLHVGLFDPRHPETGEIHTDSVIAELIGAKLAPWPGRGWLESMVSYRPSEVGYSAVIRSYDQQGRRVALSLGLVRAISELPTIEGASLVHRVHERTSSSWLLTVYNGDVAKVVESTLARLRTTAGRLGDAAIDFVPGDVYDGEPVRITPSRLTSGLLAHADGSLIGLCRVSGVLGVERRGSPLDVALHSELFSQALSLIEEGSYNEYVIYLKATDWASHNGSRQLKSDWLRRIDRDLIAFIESMKGSLHLTMISDHRTDVGSQGAEDDSSIFATSAGVADACPFIESQIERIWKGRPLTLEELSCLAFPTSD